MTLMVKGNRVILKIFSGLMLYAGQFSCWVMVPVDRLIGGIEALCYHNNLPVLKRA